MKQGELFATPKTPYSKWHEEGFAGTFHDFLCWSAWVPGECPGSPDAPGTPNALIPPDETWSADYARQFRTDLEETSDAATRVRIRNKLST